MLTPITPDGSIPYGFLMIYGKEKLINLFKFA